MKDYNHFQFFAWFSEAYGNQPCLLCGKTHSIQIHQFVRRNTDAGNKNKIHVFRIICETNFEFNKTEDKKRQYTLTILPGFLIPQSRVQVKLIFNAINDFLVKKLTKQQATLLMNCESRHSFSLYFSRFTNRLWHWAMFVKRRFIQRMQKDPSQTRSEETGLPGMWQRFKNIVSTIKTESINALPQGNEHRKMLEYVHVLLIGCKNGLGP